MSSLLAGQVRADGVPRVDFGENARDYVQFRRGLPDELFARLRAAGIGTWGQHVVDLGAGTGAMSVPLAARGCRVTAVDPSERMLAALQAVVDAAADGAGGGGEALSISPRHATAEATGLPDGGADAVTASTAWHWFDGPVAAREALRVLVPGGKLAIVNLDWRHAPIVDDALAILDRAHGGRTPWPSQGAVTYAPWPDVLEAAGFIDVVHTSFPCAHAYDRAGWHGRLRASTGFLSLDDTRRRDVDAALGALVAAAPPTFEVPHRCTLILASKPR